MKIMILGNFGTSWDGSICDEENVAQALERKGHRVLRQQREAAVELLKGPPDFILVSQWDGYPADLLPYLKETYDCPIIYWAFDYQSYQPQEWHERLIAGSDLFLGKELSNMRYPNFRWCPADFAPSFLDRFDGEVEKDIDVLFTGSNLPWCADRQELLKAIDKKFNLHVYSMTPHDWISMGLKNVHPPVVDNGLPQLIARARVNLSIDLYHAPGFWSDRNAQIMACGGLVLFRHVPFSEVIFRDHICYFYDIKDCLDKLEQLLDRSDEDLMDVADGAYEYAQEYLMVDQRVQDMLTIVGEVL